MSVHLSPDFESPQVRAKLQLFMLFAKATRDNLVFAYENLPNRYSHAGMKPIDFAVFKWIGLATNLNCPAAVFSVSIPIIDS